MHVSYCYLLDDIAQLSQFVPVDSLGVVLIQHVEKSTDLVLNVPIIPTSISPVCELDNRIQVVVFGSRMRVRITN